VEGVVLQPKQFSFFNGKSEWRRQFVQDHYGYWRLAQKAWEQSEFTNMARGANHYFNEAINPSWASSMEFTTQIGQHKFYKD
jgi:spore germination cell wall hydrolase CwlJ-like protein